MNFYMIEKPSEKVFPELIQAVKQFLKERLAGAIEDPVLKLAYDGINPFFLKTHAGILWVQVLEEPMRNETLRMLKKDLEQVGQMFRQKTKFYLFAPGYEADWDLSQLSPETAFFEYCFMRSRFGQGVGIREWKADEIPAGISPEPAAAVPAKIRAENGFKNVKLDREELSELIDLSLEFKCWGPCSV